MSNANLKHAFYAALIKKKKLVCVLTILLTLIVALFAISAGSLHIPVSDVIKTLLGSGSLQNNTVIREIRLPRVITAIVVGAVLASSGAVMQCVLQNPLASASTLGVSQGAAFGAAVGIIVFGGGVISSQTATSIITINNPYIITFSAFVFGSISTIIIIALSKLKRDLGSEGLILAGVALSALFTGASTLLQYFADDTQISAVVFWTFGNLGGTEFREILLITGVLLVSLFYFTLNAWNYNALESGVDVAESLGVNTKTVTLVSMLMSAISVAVAVSFVGIISFVGLVAPHIMRRFVGNDYRYLIPSSAATGALLLVLADTFSRLIISPVILPIGAITSFLGAPVFLFLIFHGGNKNG